MNVVAAEGLSALARSLAADPVIPGKARGRGGVGPRLDVLRRTLDAATSRFLADPAAGRGEPGAEWLMDNAYLIAEVRDQVREALPPDYYRELPRLAGGPLAGETRVYAIARVLAGEGRGHVDPDRTRRFLEEYDPAPPLTMGELWALPAMLRLVLLEDLATAAERISPGEGGVPAGEGPAAAAFPAAEPERIGTYVQSLRTLSTLDWDVFFEAVSRVHHVLCGDPAGVYPRMDFPTRDRYRKVVERLARRCGCSEEEVAAAAVRLCEGGGPRAGHVGALLLGRGRAGLEETLACRVPAGERLRRAPRWAGPALYLLGVAALSAAGLILLAGPALRAGGGAAVAALVLGLVPATTVALALLNWGVTHVVSPRVLPKLDFDDGIPRESRTAVMVPALLTDADEVRALVRQLELNYLGNSDPELAFALLADLPDAPRRAMPEDEAIVAAAVDGIRELNARHGGGGPGPFLLLYRERHWSEAERCWMGWERKRGKIAEFNRMVRGEPSTLRVRAGDPAALRGVRFGLTLDADTFLPQGAARRLVGTLSHPLNRAVFDEQGRVAAGYTVIQPRIEILPAHTTQTRFARIFSGERGLDLYTRAVSDVYQDLFGEGSFAGKGIYDVEAFHRSLDGRVPANSLLSHDLFEGIQGRAALASDVVVFEDFPGHVLAYMRRLHRWVRGDWQLLPWLLPRVPTEEGWWGRNRLSLLDRWKVVDNLRRSLLSASLLLLLAAGWTVLPGGAGWWTGAVAVVLGTPMLLGAAASGGGWARSRLRRLSVLHAGDRPSDVLARWGLVLAFLPYQALVEADAVGRTLARLVTRRRLLEWTSAAYAARLVRESHGPGWVWMRMAAVPGIALGLAGVVAALRPAALPFAAPLLAAWLLSPAIAYAVSRPVEPPRDELDARDLLLLREVARRTWAFFERFVGPNDNWLPPDNFQEEPSGVAAHRTSPTNSGLALLSTLAAYDLGYVPLSQLAARVENAFDTLGDLERYRGHFLNWYDTRDLTPLEPRYVSTVDSGNLAGALLALSEAVPELQEAPLARPEGARGLMDALEVLRSTVGRVAVGNPGALVAPLEQVEALAQDVAAAPPAWWGRLLVELTDERLPRLEAGIVNAVEAWSGELGPGALGDLRFWIRAVEQQAATHRREVEDFLPWALLPPEPPGEFGPGRDVPAVRDAWSGLAAYAAEFPSLREVQGVAGAAGAALRRLEAALEAPSRAGPPPPEALAWTRDFSARLAGASERARVLSASLERLRAAAAGFVEEMDFSFLYDPERRLFRIGYDVSSGTLDRSFYDLLASEARLASLLAIAAGQAPARHWLQLGRPFNRVHGDPVLLSWGGSMFEYLLPGLLTRTPPGSLLDLASRAAVAEQLRYGREHGVPWGVSESAYHELDAHATYQYRAFGVPELALRRDAGDRLVVAPYASLMALAWAPREVLRNAVVLAGLGGLGPLGFYEALDYGPASRRPRRAPQVVRSYMAHHQGMILVAAAERLGGPAMVERFHRNPGVSAVEHLLFEQVPGRVRLEPRTIPRPEPAAGPGLPQVGSWSVPATATPPPAQVLSNGHLSVLVTARGGGGIRLRGAAVTAWDADASLDAGGCYLYLRDLDEGPLWSAAASPTHAEPEQYEVRFSPDRAEFHRRQEGISSRVSVTVAPGAPVEIRRVSLLNESGRPRRLLAASYGEVVLADPAEYRRHPAFRKLFVESEFRPDLPALVFRRRTAAPDEETLFAVHAAVPRGGVELVGWATDRAAFLGRDGSLRDPAGLRGDGPGPGTAGTPLDPVFSLAFAATLPPGEEVELDFLTAAGATEAEVLQALDAYRSPGRVALAFDEARERSAQEMFELGIPPEEAELHQRLFSAVVHPRGGRPVPPAGVPGQAALWAVGVSGDLPVVLVRIANAEESRPLLRAVVRAHAGWRRAGARVDLLVLDREPAGYVASAREWLQEVLAETGSTHWLERPGGIHHVPAERVGAAALVAMEAAASVVLDAERGSLATQLAALEALPPRLPGFVPVVSEPPSAPAVSAVARPADLRFDNGLGGFTPDGREYVVHLEPGRRTPAPWINVVANPEFGFTVSESGAGFTWSGNSGEHRLTPWTNDPVLDPSGEALYLRDEETAEIWSPTPRPAPSGAAYQVRHGAGYSRFLHASHGLEQDLVLFVPPDEPVKVARIVLRNLWPRQRRITVTYYAEWVLGAGRAAGGGRVVTELDTGLAAILARPTFPEQAGARTAFLAAGERCHGATGDRVEFLGGPGDPAAPAALRRIGLAGSFGAGLDPCGALQVHVDLEPDEQRTLHFLLGDGATREEALDRVRRFRDPAVAEGAFRAATALWDDLLGGVRVRTPDPALDVALGRWLPYQALACRVWGRSALYQSSGAFGFRDQLQDVLALLHLAPGLARSHVLDAAAHQFVEGDVLHWWHPGSGQGVRTRCSDDLLWLPYVAAAYVEATGDEAVLDETVPYLEGPALLPGESERYAPYPAAETAGTLYDHCLRALDRAGTRGRNGLPLIGSCDWNDAMNRVGAKGEGESVWLGWFLFAVLERFARVCDRRGDAGGARRLRASAATLRDAVEARGWDGSWYRRAYFDDGSPLGSARNPEGAIDSLTQSWAVISGGARPERAREAMQAVLDRLVSEDDRLVLLLRPPFDAAVPSPGYIRAYPPGVRENGGQYTHAAVWVGWAFAALGDGGRAGAVFDLLNPVSRATDPAAVERYRVEPYVVAADVYGAPPHTGRGGWTWYTGSAAWLYRLGMEAILGVRREGHVLRLEPCIPPGWPEYEVVYRHGGATYRVRVTNPEGVSRGVASVELDGAPVPDGGVPLADDGAAHEVLVRLGGPGAEAVHAAAPGVAQEEGSDPLLSRR